MTGSGNPYHDWWTSRTPEEQAAYRVLLAQGRVVACHFALKPTLFGGHPVEVLPDDYPLLNDKVDRPFRSGTLSTSPPLVEAVKEGSVPKKKKMPMKPPKDMGKAHKEMHGGKPMKPMKPVKKGKK